MSHTLRDLEESNEFLQDQVDRLWEKIQESEDYLDNLNKQLEERTRDFEKRKNSLDVFRMALPCS
jgi:peptidoglycan hydrolase CwlO-like protein